MCRDAGRGHALDHLRVARILLGETRSFLGYLVAMAIAEAEGQVPFESGPPAGEINHFAEAIQTSAKEGER